MKGKEKLAEILDLKTNLEILEEEYQSHLERATKITQPYKDDCVQESDFGDKIATNAISMADIFNELNGVWDDYIATKRECLSILFEIKDKKCRRLLYLRYFKDKPWAYIAEVLRCTEETVRGHIHNRALNFFEKIFNSKGNDTE